jgi:hypothetical protein
MCPVVPSQYEELIIQPSDSFCVAFKKLLHCIYLDYLVMRYETKEDGSIADAHAADLCAAVNTHCTQTETTDA